LHVAFEFFVNDPSSNASNSATANNEQLHGCGKFIVGNRKEIGIGLIIEYDSALFENRLESLDVVTKFCRTLVVLLVTRDQHARSKALDVLVVASAHEVGEVIRELLVVFFADSLNAGSAALADVSEQARAIGALGSVEDSRATAAHRVNLEQCV
jgi:hypothetical protein